LLRRLSARGGANRRLADIGNGRQDFFIFAFAASHAALVISKKPWPLQLFCPLQELCADAHAEAPLQELTPSHFTFASSAAFAVVSGAVLNIIAAAVAKAAAESFLLLIIVWTPTIDSTLQAWSA
jgi:hypothetical protein